MGTFKSLKNKNNSLQRLSKAIEAGGKQSYKDIRYYEPTLDKNGNASVVMRFLPSFVVDGEDAPDYVSYFHHNFKGPTGKYYRNFSLTTLNKEDPVTELFFNIRNSGIPDAYKKARPLTRKQKIVANVLIIKDENNPAAEGKVFLYGYGVKIKGKIDAAAGFKADGTPIDVESLGEDAPAFFSAFDLDNGANFNLVVKRVNVDGTDMPNYDDSTFLKPRPLFNGDEEKQEEVCKKCYSLAAEVGPDKYKTYEELQKDLDRAMGSNNSGNAPAPRKSVADEESGDSGYQIDNSRAEARPPVKAGDDSDDDSGLFDDADYSDFKKLMNK